MAIRILGVVLFCACSAAFAVDYTFYLPWQRFPKFRIEGDHFEVHDAFDNEFVLRVDDGPNRRMAIANSMVFDLLGLPNATVYPTYALQLSNGSIWVQENVPPGSQWVPATLQPKIRYGAIPVGLSLHKAHQWVTTAVTGYVLGFANPEATAVYSRTGHIVVAPGRQSFENYGPNSTLARHLAPVGFGAWSYANSDQFSRALNVTLTRLESISAQQWETIFGWAWQGEAGSARKQEFFRRIQTLRAEVAAYLSEPVHGFSFPADSLRAPATIPPPHLLLPPLESGRGKGKVDKLWSDYFAEQERFRVAPEDFLASRKEATLDDSRICEVGQHMDPSVGGETLPQVALNKHNETTLVVLAVNDAEASEIAFIAKFAYAKTLEFEGEDFRHGTRLTELLVKRILQEAKDVGAKRLIVSELPGSPEVEALLRKTGLEVFIVDHHNYENDKRFNSRASLEQVAEILGVKLPPVSRAIAIGDSKFIYGKLELGVPPHLLLPRQKVTPPEDTREYAMRGGKLIYLKHHMEHPSDFEAQEIVRAYPRHANVLTTSEKGLHFAGEPHLVARLIAIAQSNLGRTGHHFSGGGYVRMLLMPGQRDHIVKLFLAHLAREEGLQMGVRYHWPSICHQVTGAADEKSPSS